MQVGHQHQIALHVNIGGKEESVERLQVLTIHAKPLKPFVGSVSDDQFGNAVANIQPVSMWRAELSGFASEAAECSDKLIIRVVLKHVMASIAIAQIITTVWSEAGICRSENCVWISKQTVTFGIDRGPIFLPDDFTTQRHLSKAHARIRRRKVEEFFAAFPANGNAVTFGRRSRIVNFGHRFDKASNRIKHEQGSRIPVMSDIDQSLRIDGDSMSRIAIVIARRKTGSVPVVNALIGKVTVANDWIVLK